MRRKGRRSKKQHVSGKTRASLVAQMVKNLPAMWETQVPSLVKKIPWRRAW